MFRHFKDAIGKTFEEVIENIREVIALCLEEFKKML
jgi:predicted RNase H-like HicB family nuclease